jgi:hypothetical protein
VLIEEQRAKAGSAGVARDVFEYVFADGIPGARLAASRRETDAGSEIY